MTKQVKRKRCEDMDKIVYNIAMAPDDSKMFQTIKFVNKKTHSYTTNITNVLQSMYTIINKHFHEENTTAVAQYNGAPRKLLKI